MSKKIVIKFRVTYDGRTDGPDGGGDKRIVVCEDNIRAFARLENCLEDLLGQPAWIMTAGEAVLPGGFNNWSAIVLRRLALGEGVRAHGVDLFEIDLGTIDTKMPR